MDTKPTAARKPFAKKDAYAIIGTLAVVCLATRMWLLLIPVAFFLLVTMTSWPALKRMLEVLEAPADQVPASVPKSEMRKLLLFSAIGLGLTAMAIALSILFQ